MELQDTIARLDCKRLRDLQRDVVNPVWANSMLKSRTMLCVSTYIYTLLLIMQIVHYDFAVVTPFNEWCDYCMTIYLERNPPLPPIISGGYIPGGNPPEKQNGTKHEGQTQKLVVKLSTMFLYPVMRNMASCMFTTCS